jgi:NAD(P)H dehydrogenase (quinone)
VHALDLYAQGFDAVMTRAERLAYDAGDLLEPQTREAAGLVRQATVLVVVYPTWWFGLPAILKGWLERVLVPGVAFTFDERTGKLRRGLHELRHIVGITTYGGSRAAKLLAADGGRRTLTRALRLSAHPLARTTWLGLHAMDTTTPADRLAFLDRVERTLVRR